MLLAALSLSLALSGSADAQGLSVGYYSKTCPQAEAIVFEEMTKIIEVAPSLAGPLLRMHFHDCFVRVCSFAPEELNHHFNGVYEFTMNWFCACRDAMARSC